MDKYDEAKQITRIQNERAIGFNGGLGNKQSDCTGARDKLIAKTMHAKKGMKKLVKHGINKTSLYLTGKRYFEAKLFKVLITQDNSDFLPSRDYQVHYYCKIWESMFERTTSFYGKTPLEAYQKAKIDYKSKLGGS